jgi:hypothetical protein
MRTLTSSNAVVRYQSDNLVDGWLARSGQRSSPSGQAPPPKPAAARSAQRNGASSGGDQPHCPAAAPWAKADCHCGRGGTGVVCPRRHRDRGALRPRARSGADHHAAHPVPVPDGQRPPTAKCHAPAIHDARHHSPGDPIPGHDHRTGYGLAKHDGRAADDNRHLPCRFPLVRRIRGRSHGRQHRLLGDLGLADSRGTATRPVHVGLS